MQDHPLTPADPDDVVQALAHALRYQGRRPARDAEHAMARITAERLIEHLKRAGFVMMKARPASPHGAELRPRAETSGCD